jgi:hypothetical protein
MVVTYWGMYWGIQRDKEVEYIITPVINRPYRQETVLIVGCGDTYQQDHSHQYTIDLDPWANPCVIASFGKDDLTSILPANVFLHIICEAVFPLESDNGIVYKTLIYLLSLGGEMCMTNGHNWGNKVRCRLHKTNDHLLQGDNGKIICDEKTLYEWYYEIIYK